MLVISKKILKLATLVDCNSGFTHAPEGPCSAPHTDASDGTPDPALLLMVLLTLSQHIPPNKSICDSAHIISSQYSSSSSSSSTWLQGEVYKALRDGSLQATVLPLRHQMVLLCSVCPSRLHPAFFWPRFFNQLWLLTVFTYGTLFMEIMDRHFYPEFLLS